jgi:hypothetical protein
LRIILEVRQDSSGRFEGSLQAPDSHVARPFEGVLELVGLLEACLAAPQNGSLGVAAEKSGETP